MPFGRKNKKPLLSYLRGFFIFLTSFSRIRKYIGLSLKRLKGSPNELAIGLATGIAVSFTPFLGLHALIAISIAWIMRGSMASALIGTLFGNPWTFPVIWYITLEFGKFLYLNFDSQLVIENITLNNLKEEITILLILFKNIFISLNIDEIKLNFSSLKLIPLMTLGSIPLVIISWFISYFISINVIKSYKKRMIKKKI